MAQFWILTNIYVTVSLSKDTNAMTQFKAVKGVFHAQVGRYTLTFYDAQRLCALLGATLATHDQLYTAWEAGLQKCAWVVLYSSVFATYLSSPSYLCSKVSRSIKEVIFFELLRVR